MELNPAMPLGVENPLEIRRWVAQRADLNTVWMNVGQWLATHPPIAKRLAVLDPTLDPRPIRDPMPQLAAALLVAVAFILPIVGAVHLLREVLPRMQAGLAAQQAKEETQRTAEIASAHIVSLAAAADAYQGEHNGPPPQRRGTVRRVVATPSHRHRTLGSLQRPAVRL